MPGKRVVSASQMKFLLDYMIAHPDFAKGNFPCTADRIEKNDLLARWKHLACTLNADASGCKKTGVQWREYWNHAKYSARKKACTIRKQLKELMKGDPLTKLFSLSENEKRVLVSVGVPLPELPFIMAPPDTTQPSASSALIATPVNTSPVNVSPLNTSQPLEALPQVKSQPDSPPPDALPPATSPERDRSASVTSGSESSHSISPLLERSPPIKSPWARPVKRKAAYESATSTTRVYSAPYGSTAKKRYRQAGPSAPEWVQHIEERRIAVEERSARALQGIQANTEFCASALQGIHIAQERMNRTLQGIQSALEASARALQGRRS